MKFTKQIPILLALYLTTISSIAQNFADTKHYLVDSLDLNTLSADDKEIIESSLLKFHQEKNDTSKILALNDICENMVHDDWAKYQKYQLKLILKSLEKPALNEKIETSLKRSLAGAYNNLGYINNMGGNIKMALEFFKKSADIYDEIGFQEGYAATVNNIGYIYQKQGDVYNALEFYQKSLDIDEIRGNKKGVAASLNNLGFVYNMLGDTAAGLDYYHRSLIIKKELGDNKGIAGSYNNIGLVYSKLGEYDKALSYHYNSLELRVKIKDIRGEAESYNNIGSVYRYRGEIDTALVYYRRSLKLKEKAEDKEGMAYTLHNIGQILKMKGQIEGPEGAFSVLLKSLKISQEIGVPSSISAAAETLSEIYEVKGDYKKTFEMHKLFILMRDSIVNERNQRNAAKLQAKYAYEQQKIIDDVEHDKILAVEQEAQGRQKVVIYAITFGAILLIVFLIFVFNRLRITRAQKVIIQRSNENLHQINEEVLAQRDQIEGQKNEIESKHEEIHKSISYAKRIQTAILPPQSFISKFLPKHFVFYKPKDIVAGDFYWLEVHDDIVFFAVADCTGHGVPGAMVSVVCHNALNRAVREFALRDTGLILDKVRLLVVDTFEKSEEQMKDGMDISLCAWNKKSNQLQFSGANNSLYVIQDETLKTIKGTKQPIGHVENPVPYEKHMIDVSKPTFIYLTSDGYADQFGGYKHKKFGYQQTRKSFIENYHKPINEQKEFFSNTIQQWMYQGSEEQLDDICLIGIEL